MTVWRLLAAVALAYLLGFAAFALTLGRPQPAARTDAIVVPTGGAGRIARGLDLIERGQAKRMLISGAAPGVRPIDLAIEYRVSPRLFACCVDLGYEAVDTRSNADEIARWVRDRRYRTVRLVTAESHMPRARLELTNALGPGVRVIEDAVPTEPTFGTLVAEYHKYLVRSGALLLRLGG